jgi:hypothetical protein
MILGMILQSSSFLHSHLRLFEKLYHCIAIGWL